MSKPIAPQQARKQKILPPMVKRVAAVSSVADKARRVADNLDLIACSATGAEAPAKRLEAPAQLVDKINDDMVYVLEWIERRRSPASADRLEEGVAEVVAGLSKRPRRAPSGALILETVAKARHMEYKLRQWAQDIEKEERDDDQSDKLRKRRGRKRLRDSWARERNERLAEYAFWRSEGDSKEDFCKTHGITLKRLNNWLSWKRMRNIREKRGANK
jgi:hypothetical protein